MKPQDKLTGEIRGAPAPAQELRRNVKALPEIYVTCPEGHEVEHKIPISKGGLHCPSNLQHLPTPANRRKGAKLLPKCQ